MNVVKFNSFLILAVASHKYVIAFCVGLELHNADTPKILYIVYMLIFSLMSPIGIAIGIAVTSAMESQTTAYILTTGVLQVRYLPNIQSRNIMNVYFI